MMMMNEFFLLFQFQFMAEFTLFGALEMGGVFWLVSRLRQEKELEAMDVWRRALSVAWDCYGARLSL